MGYRVDLYVKAEITENKYLLNEGSFVNVAHGSA